MSRQDGDVNKGAQLARLSAQRILEADLCLEIIHFYSMHAFRVTDNGNNAKSRKTMRREGRVYLGGIHQKGEALPDCADVGFVHNFRLLICFIVLRLYPKQYYSMTKVPSFAFS